MRKLALASGAALLMTSVMAGAQARPGPAFPPLIADEQAGCADGDLAPTPQAFLVRRPRGPVKLETLVLVDPSVVAEAEEAMEGAAKAFAEHGIRLVPTYRAVPVPDLSGDDEAYMDWAKDQVGRRTPPGIDVVYLALHYPIGVGGRADCVGGITTDSTSFAIGMLTTGGIVGVVIEGYPLPQGPPIPDAGAKVAAHEIGHLLGAHHHFGQCGAGFPASDPEHPCDVMLSLARQQMGLFFGPVTGPVIRHFANGYARP